MKIAIVKLSALGDIVHAMVVLQFIKNSNQKILVDWIVDDTYQQLLESNPDINKIHVINIKKAKKKKSLYMLINELIQTRKMGPYDLVIDMQGLIKSAIISWMIPSSVTLGFDQSSIREGIASIFYNKTFKFGYEKNVIERNIALINFALGSYINSDLVQHKLPFLYSINKHVFNGLSKRKKNILIIPGASNTSKCYPSLKFAELSNLLDANIIISWGSKNEKKLADEIKFQSEKVIVSDNLSLEFLSQKRPPVKNSSLNNSTNCV